MDKRTLLAIILIFVVFWLSNQFIWKPKQQLSTPAQTVNEQTNEPVSSDTTTEAIAAPQPVIESDIEINNNIILENEFVRYSFSNKGAVLNSVELKKYFLADKTSFANLIPADNSIMGVELQMASGNLLNLSNNVFQPEIGSNQIKFSLSTEQGNIVKIFRLNEEYQLDYELIIEGYDNLSGYNLNMESGIADTEEFLKMKTREYKVVGQIDNTITKYSLAKLKEQHELPGHLDWASIKSKYFMMGIIPDELIESKKLTAFKNNDSPAFKFNVATPQHNIDHKYSLYFGPLIYEKLEIFGTGIENTVEMGPKFLQWISRIFMAFLKLLNSFIPNWGITLVIFSLVLKILLYPLTHHSYESSIKMQKINPLIKDIQAKYKHDPQTMNKEMHKLYKEHGVNPLGGCLPLLLQMPILFALYPVLRYSIALRQASFMWLPDLSEPDPRYILPVAMAIFMFVQQKLMAPAKAKIEEMDEKQQAAMQSQRMMMYIMPIMMLFIFKSLASGLVLYWTIFSIIGTFQQIVIKKKFS